MAMNKRAAVVNAAVLEQLSNPAMKKNAEDGINDYIREELREEGFARKIIPMRELADDELTPQLGTDMNVKLEWKESVSHGAMTIPFGATARAFFIRGPNWPIYFSEIVGTQYVKHMDEMRVYPYDIRQMLSDHSVRDIEEEEDRRFLVEGVDVAIGTVNTASPYTGAVQYRRLTGGWTRANVAEAMKTIRRGPTKTATDKCVINAVTVYEFLKWGRDEMGGDMSQELLKDGSATGSWLGGDWLQCRWLVTIKYGLVPDNSIYMFSTPEYMGKLYSLTDITLYTDRKAQLITFYPYETIGGGFGNIGGMGRVDIADA